MAEAIATMSLVCDVMQVISFTGEVFGMCQRVGKDGSLEAGLEDNTERLSALASTLESNTTGFAAVFIGRSKNISRAPEMASRPSLEAKLLSYISASMREFAYVLASHAALLAPSDLGYEYRLIGRPLQIALYHQNALNSKSLGKKVGESGCHD
ncbi:hypothetical protein F5Y05DRAFT_262075 [Hypoxylon sp. FL0543]|nr:hypothetical protein F5Y05DRAFT_262075 [Hypoxylon sp. FL0543]